MAIGIRNAKDIKKQYNLNNSGFARILGLKNSNSFKASKHKKIVDDLLVRLIPLLEKEARTK